LLEETKKALENLPVLLQSDADESVLDLNIPNRFRETATEAGKPKPVQKRLVKVPCNFTSF